MAAVSPPKARMEFKTTEQVKNLLIEAASMSGVDLTAFVINAAAERTRAVLEECARIELDAEAHARFAAALANPPQPTDALRDLMALPELPTR